MMKRAIALGCGLSGSDEITGVGRTAAQMAIAEIGLDMTRFPTPGHLCSWARVRTRFHDLGAPYFVQHTSTQRKIRNHVSQLNALGYRVTLEPAA